MLPHFKISILVLLLINFSDSHSQVKSGINYLTIRDSIYTLSCGVQSGESVRTNQFNLERLSDNNISKGKEVYYRDLGFTYYVLFGMYGDVEALDKSTQFYKKAVTIAPKYYEAWHDLSHNYFFQGNCEEVNKSVSKALKYTPRKDRKNQRKKLNSLVIECQTNN